MAKNVNINICIADLEENEPFQWIFLAENISSGKVTGHKERLHTTFSTLSIPSKVEQSVEFSEGSLFILVVLNFPNTVTL